MGKARDLANLLADGAVGTSEIADGAITSGKLASGAAASNLGSFVSSVNGQTGAVTISATPTTAQVLAATAGASVGAVGTYAFLSAATSTLYSAGSTAAGSNLRYAGMAFDDPMTGSAGGNSTGARASGTPSGTWRCMGFSTNLRTNTGEAGGSGATVWLRIS